MELGNCVSDLEGEGYNVQCFVIPACAVNARHRRDRVWIVANSTSRGRNTQSLSVSKCTERENNIDADQSSKGSGSRIVGNTQHTGRDQTQVRQGNPQGDDGGSSGTQTTFQFGGSGSQGETLANSKSQGTGSHNGRIRKGTGRIGGREEAKKETLADRQSLLRQRSIPKGNQGGEPQGETGNGSGDKDGGNSVCKGLQGQREKSIGVEQKLGDTGNFCRRSVSSEFHGIFDGLSKRLDEIKLIYPSALEDLDANGTSTEERPYKILRSLRELTKKKALQRHTGINECIPKEKILRPSLLCKGNQKKRNSVQVLPEEEGSKKFHKESMRNMRNKSKASDTPHKQGQIKQQAFQLEDTLLVMSHEASSRSGRHLHEEAKATMQGLRKSLIQIGAMSHPSFQIQEAWESISEEDKEWCIMATYRGPFHSEYPNTPRVSSGIPNRVDRIKALGNAIVPQVVFQIFQAISKPLDTNSHHSHQSKIRKRR